MNPEDSMPNAASETIEQTAAVEKQMGAEQAAAEAATPKPEVDNSILAEPTTETLIENEPKPLFEIAASPAKVDPTVLKAEDMLVAPDTTPKPAKKSNKTPIFIVIALIALALVGLGVWALASFLGKDNGGAVANPERTAFFLENQKGDGTFALFDDTGAKLTDFTYSDKYAFTEEGYAIVRENGSEVAILANNGRLSVPYGKYSDISQTGVFFLATEKNGDKVLIKGDGEKITDVDDCYALNGIIVASLGDEINIYTIKGESLGKLNDSEKPKGKKAIKNTIAINAGGYLYMIDTNTGDVILKIEQKEAYNIFGMNNTRTTYALQNVRTGKYDAVIIAGKYFEWDYSEKHLPFTASDGDYVYYENSAVEGYWIMGSDGKKIKTEKVNGHTVFFDSEHYAYMPYSTKTLTVVVKGETKAINDVYKLSHSDENYIIVHDNAPTEIYDKDLKLIRKFPKNSYSISGPDKNGNYLLDRGTIVNEKNEIIELPKEARSASITVLENGDYLLENYEKEMGIIDAEGKEKLKFDRYTDIKIENGVMAAKDKDDKFVLFDADYNITLKDFDTINIKDGYVEATKGDKLEYYTYSGKLIYEG